MPDGYLPRITRYNAEHVRESVLSPTQDELDPEVWRKVDDTYELDGTAQGFLVGVAAQLGRFGSVKAIYLVGSMCSYQWEPDSDLDLTVVLDPRTEDMYGEAIAAAMRVEGMDKLPGTQHTCNPYVETEEDSDLGVQDGLYNVLENKWVRGPYSLHADVAKYINQFRRVVRAIDIVAGELKRDLMDYHELEQLDPERLAEMGEQIEKIVTRLNREAQVLERVYGKAHADRTAVFSDSVSLEELKEWHSRQLMPGNVIYKLLERYHYLALMKAVHAACERSTGPVDSPEEVDDLEKALGMGKPEEEALAEARKKPVHVGSYGGWIWPDGEFEPGDYGEGADHVKRAAEKYNDKNGFSIALSKGAFRLKEYYNELSIEFRTFSEPAVHALRDLILRVSPSEIDTFKFEWWDKHYPDHHLKELSLDDAVEFLDKALNTGEFRDREYAESYVFPHARSIPRHLYHGTTKERARQIQSSGMINPVRWHDKDYVWLSSDWYKAFDHAASRAGKRGEEQDIVVLRVDVPGQNWRKVRSTIKPDVYVFNGQIPVEWVKAGQVPVESLEEDKEWEPKSWMGPAYHEHDPEERGPFNQPLMIGGLSHALKEFTNLFVRSDFLPGKFQKHPSGRYRLHPGSISRGWCFIWAYIAHKLFGGTLLSLFEDIFGGHAFLKFEDKYYDSDTPEGVTRWDDLPFYDGKDMDGWTPVEHSDRDFLKVWQCKQRTNWEAQYMLAQKFLQDRGVFFESLNEQDPGWRYYYHCTSADRIPGIAKKGLAPSTDPHWGGDLGVVSMGHVFASKKPKDAIYYGILRFRDDLQNNHAACVPTLLRFVPRVGAFRNDPATYQDVMGSVLVPPSRIEIHWQKKWVPILSVKDMDWEDMTYELDPDVPDDQPGGYRDWDGNTFDTGSACVKDAKEFVCQGVVDVRKVQGTMYDFDESLAESSIRKSFWKNIGNLKVYIVDGQQVRETYNLDFAQGGNECAYDWIPKGEIWIDDGIPEDERRHVLFHEVYERSLMLFKGMGYDPAHDRATEAEKKERRKAGHKVTAESVRHGFGMISTQELGWVVDEYYKELKQKAFGLAQYADQYGKLERFRDFTVYPQVVHTRYGKQLKLPEMLVRIYWRKARDVKQNPGQYMCPAIVGLGQYRPNNNEIDLWVTIAPEKDIKDFYALFDRSRVPATLFEELDHWNTLGPGRAFTGKDLPDLDAYSDKHTDVPGEPPHEFVPDEHRIPWQEWVVVLDYAHNLKQKGWTKEAVVRELVTHKGMTKETAQAAWDEAEQYQVEGLTHRGIDEVYFVWTPESGLLTMKDGDKRLFLSGDKVVATTVADHNPLIVTWWLQKNNHKLGDILKPKETKETLHQMYAITNTAFRGCFYLGDKSAGIQFYDTWDKWDKEAQHEAWLATEAIWRKFPEMQNVKPVNMSGTPLSDYPEESLHEDEVFANRHGQKFWGDKGAGILPIAKSTGRMLLSMRSSEVNEPNTWGTWGGRTDEEDPRDGALRELREECGYQGSVRMIPSTVFHAKGFSYHNYLGVVEDEFTPEMGWEVESYKWVDLDEALEIEPKHFGLKHLLSKAESQIRKVVGQLKPSTRQQVEQMIDERLHGGGPPVAQHGLFTNRVSIPEKFTPEYIAELVMKESPSEMDSYSGIAEEELGFSMLDRSMTAKEQAKVNDRAEEIFKEESIRLAEDALDNLSELSDPLNLYRVMTTKPSSPSHVGRARTGIDEKKLGICWSWDPEAAEAHWGKHSTGRREIEMYAQVEAKYVDWEVSLLMNSQGCFAEEKEIRLKEGSPIRVTRIKVQNGPWRKVNLIGKA